MSSFWQLYQKSVFPLAPVMADNVKYVGNHSFVAIGVECREPDETQHMLEWHQDAVICDPWLLEFRRESKTSKSDNTGAYTAEEFRDSTKYFFNDHDKVTVIFSIAGQL